MSEKNRDFLFDNYKAFLMIMVIVGHFIQLSYKEHMILYVLKYFIYAFHMPAFVFVSGYFSKKDAPLTKTIQKVFIPYLAFQLIYCVYYDAMGLNVSWVIDFPKFSLWYLLALSIWKAVTPYLRKIPYIFWISLVVSLVFGCFDIEGEWISISRIFVFYPYFLAGMFLNGKQMEKLRTLPCKVVGLGGMAAYIFFAATHAKDVGFRLNYFYGKASYAGLGLGALEGVRVRLIAYAIGFFMTYAVIALMTKKETVFSKIGGKTLSIYLFHGLLLKFLERQTSLLDHVNTIPEIALLLAFCVALAFVFSMEPFCKCVNVISGVQVQEIPQTFRLWISDISVPKHSMVLIWTWKKEESNMPFDAMYVVMAA